MITWFLNTVFFFAALLNIIGRNLIDARIIILSALANNGDELLLTTSKVCKPFTLEKWWNFKSL